MPKGTDLTIFKQAGMHGLGFTIIDHPWNNHRPTDSRANVDLGSLQQMGEATLGLTRTLASDFMEVSTGENDVYFNILGSLFFHYPEQIVPWLSALAIVMTLLLVVLGFRHGKLHLSQLFKVVAIFPFSLLIAGLMGIGVRGQFRSYIATGKSRRPCLSFTTHGTPFVLSA